MQKIGVLCKRGSDGPGRPRQLWREWGGTSGNVEGKGQLPLAGRTRTDRTRPGEDKEECRPAELRATWAGQTEKPRAEYRPGQDTGGTGDGNVSPAGIPVLRAAGGSVAGWCAPSVPNGWHSNRHKNAGSCRTHRCPCWGCSRRLCAGPYPWGRWRRSPCRAGGKAAYGAPAPPVPGHPAGTGGGG